MPPGILAGMPSDALEDLWPAAGIRARAGDLELRWIDDDLLVDLARVAGRGIHDADRMPFATPWTRGTPDEVARSILAYQWDVFSQVGSARWVLELGVLVDGVPVGIQSASAKEWSVLRSAETGSWLGREHQGRGIGTRMRVLLLELLFDGLGAQEATSGAFAETLPPPPCHGPWATSTTASSATRAKAPPSRTATSSCPGSAGSRCGRAIWRDWEPTSSSSEPSACAPCSTPPDRAHATARPDPSGSRRAVVTPLST